MKEIYLNRESSSAESASLEQLKRAVIEKAEQLGVQILTEKDIDEKLGDKPYATHTIVSNQENVIKVLDAGKLQSSKAVGGGSMTWESDKLIGMDDNVFFALGKGYMRKDTYSLIFAPEVLSKMPDASFVEDDLVKFEGEFITEFMEESSKDIIESIEQNRTALREYFEKMVKRSFEGGHGIYEQYFGEHARDRVQDFLDAIKSKGFKGITEEKEVIDQFTILSDAILSEDIMPPKLRNKLKKTLEEKVIKPHTIMGAKNIHNAIEKRWKANSDSYKEFLPDDKHVPDKVVEIRVPNEADIKKAIIAIYVPTT